MAKPVTINMNNATPGKTYTCNLKGRDTVLITYDGTVNTDNFTKVSVLGSTLTIKLCDMATYKFTNIANPEKVNIIIQREDSTPQYAQNLKEFYEFMSGDINSWATKKNIITGSVFADEIDITNSANYALHGYKINAGAGNDTITGSAYNDTITAGIGNNTVIYDYHNGVQGQDIINLTKGENLTIDLTGYGIETVNGFLGLGGGRFRKSGNDLILRLSESEDKNADCVKIKNFYKTNGVGNEGNVTVLLKNAVGLNPAVTVDLNNDKIFIESDNDFVKNEKKKTAVLTGNRFSEAINITSGLKDYTKTIKAGAGENVINITSDDFGKITLAEEKVNATNIINLDSGSYSFTKNGNDLIISNNKNSELKITGYYLERTAKTKYANIKFQVAGVEKDIDDIQTELIISGKGKLVGTDGNDKFISSVSGDTITGKTGENTIVFSDKFGNDTVNLTEGERLVLDLSSYNFANDSDNIKYAFNGSNLVITVNDNSKKAYGKITLKNFGKDDVTGGDTDVSGVTAGVFLKLSDTKTVDLRTKMYVTEPRASYTGNWHDEEIYAGYTNKAVTLTGGKGNDNMYSSGGATTYVFNKGDGNDTLYETKLKDVIKINAVGDVTYNKVGNDLIISYGEDDNIRIDGYFYESDSRIDKILIKNEKGKYETKSIGEEVDVAGQLAKTYSVALDYSANDNTHTINTTDEYDTVRFINHGSFSYGEGDGENGADAGDLIINFDALNGNWDDKVILKGYVNGQSPVKYLVINNKTYEVPYHVGTDGNDTFGSSDLNEEYYYLKGGNDTITFEGDFGSENEVYSNGTKAGNTDTLRFKDLSFEDGELSIERTYSGTNDELIINYDSGRVIYNDYFSDNTPSVNVVDKNDSISLARITNSANVDWSTGADANKNHVLFVDYRTDGRTTTNLVSNGKRNMIAVDSDDSTHNRDVILNYTYKGGNDSINKMGYEASDTYNITSFTANSKLSVLESMSPDDIVNINADSDDMYLLFDVSTFGQHNYDDYDIGLVHKNAMTVETLKKFFESYNSTETTVAGVLKFSGGGWESVNPAEMDTHDYGSTIEYIRTTDNQDRLNIAAWKQKIAERVWDWLENNSAANNHKNLALNYYSVENVISKVASGEITLTNDQYQSLLDCFKVKYSEACTLEIDELAGSKTISATDGIVAVKFTQASNPEYVQFERVQTLGHTNDLRVSYSDYTVTLTDYFLGNHSTKFFKVSDPFNTTYHIPFRIGTNGNDNFTVTETDKYAENFFLNGGNDTIRFAGTDYTTSNSIYSEGTSENQTTVIIDNYSLDDDQIKFGYFRNMGDYNKLEVAFSKYDGMNHHYGAFTYEYYFDANKPTLTIQDKNSTYSIDKHTTVQNLNWSAGADADKNHVAFLLGEGTNTVISNDESNRIQSGSQYYATSGVKLDYTYNGGKDKVNSESRADDIYRVSSFDENTKLRITDNSGNDTLNINTTNDKLRLFFDVKWDGNNKEWVAVSDSAFVYSSVANKSTLEDYLESCYAYGDDTERFIDGVVITRFNDYEPTTDNNIETLTTTTGNIDLDAWKDQIATNVCAWLTTNYNWASGYSPLPTLSGAIAHDELSDGNLTALLELYNVEYTP